MGMSAQAIEKRGSCPSGYNSQGNYCVPSSGAKPVVLKHGPESAGSSA